MVFLDSFVHHQFQFVVRRSQFPVLWNQISSVRYTIHCLATWIAAFSDVDNHFVVFSRDKNTNVNLDKHINALVKNGGNQ